MTEIICPCCEAAIELNLGRLVASSNVTEARREAARNNGKKGGRPKSKTRKPRKKKSTTKQREVTP